MNARDVILCTTLIIAKNEKVQSTATGFFAKSKEVSYLVTNKHVIEEKENIELILKYKDTNDSVYNEKLSLNFVQYRTQYHPKYDLCVINIHAAISYMRLHHKQIINYFIDLDTQNDITYNDIETVVTCGYPCGFRDEYNNLPLVNNGITTTSINYNYKDQQIFLTDTHIYNGSSGSPVFIKRDNDYFFVGINYSIQPLPEAYDKLKLVDEANKKLFKHMASSVYSENIKKDVLVEILHN